MVNEKDKIQPLWFPPHSKIALLYVLYVNLCVFLVYYSRAIKPIWHLFLIGVVTWYFKTLSYYSRKWQRYPENLFLRKLFWHSLVYRIIAGVVLMTIALATWGKPDYVGAVDAITFHHDSIIVAKQFRNLDFARAYKTAVPKTGDIDDAGITLFLGLLFALFGCHYFVAVLGLSLINAYGVILLYRTAKFLWGENIGRTAGLLYMHFPLSLFFSSVIRKEGVIIVLILYLTYIGTKISNWKKVSNQTLMCLILAMITMFYFRTLTGALFAILIPGAFIFRRHKDSRYRHIGDTRFVSILLAVVVACMLGYLLFMTGKMQPVINQLMTEDDHWEEKRTAELVEPGGHLGSFSLKKLAGVPVYIVMSAVAPFPAMVQVPTRYGTPHDYNWYWMPGLMVWNILAFYSIIGFYHTVKEKLYQSFIVWSFTAGYLSSLIVTILVTRVRFAFLGMPLMLIFASVGLAKTRNIRRRTRWIMYLVALGIMTIIWNLLRLRIRGLA